MRGRVAHAGGDHIPHVGGGSGEKASPATLKHPQPCPQSPPLSAQARQLQHHGQHRERCGGAGRPCPRRGTRSHATPTWGTRHNPKSAPPPEPPHPFFHPFLLEKTHPGASAAPQPPPPPLREGGRDTTPPPRSSPPPRCSGAQPPAGVGGGEGGQSDPEQGGSKQRLRGTDGWGRRKERRMRGQGGESGSPSPPPPLGARPLPPPAPGAWYLPSGPG